MKLIMKLTSHAGNLAYYASIMLDAFYVHYAHNYARIYIISTSPLAIYVLSYYID